MTREELADVARRLDAHPTMALNHADAAAVVEYAQRADRVVTLSRPLVELLRGLLSTALPVEDGILYLVDGQLVARYVEEHGAL